jgi:hypothetical protein
MLDVFHFLNMLSDDAGNGVVQSQGACDSPQMNASTKQRRLPQAESGAEAKRIQRLHNTVPENSGAYHWICTGDGIGHIRIFTCLGDCATVDLEIGLREGQIRRVNSHSIANPSGNGCGDAPNQSRTTDCYDTWRRTRV